MELSQIEIQRNGLLSRLENEPGFELSLEDQRVIIQYQREFRETQFTLAKQKAEAKVKEPKEKKAKEPKIKKPKKLSQKAYVTLLMRKHRNEELTEGEIASMQRFETESVPGEEII